jgi:hypothetical protein
MLALQRQTPQEVAREGFISAALEAGILSLGPHLDHAKLASAAVSQEHVLPDLHTRAWSK